MAVPTLPLKPGQLELVRSLVTRIRAGDVGALIEPWRDIVLAPKNGITGRPYSGMNRFATTFIGFLRDYTSQLWLTEKQIADRGGQILPKELENSVPVVFTGRFQFVDGYKTLCNDGQKAMTLEGGVSASAPVLTPDTLLPAATGNLRGDSGISVPVYSAGFFCKEYKIWNLSQTTGVRLPKKIASEIAEESIARLSDTADTRLERLRSAILKADVAPIFYDRSYDCYYDIGRHEIHAPRQGLFNSELDKWESISHELIHATGAKHLLNRPTVVDFKGRGTPEHALEEITAIMGSIFMCHDCGVAITPERERSFIAELSSYDIIGILEKSPSLFVRALIYADFAAQFTLHPENRPQFIRDRSAPNQIEFTFDEFSHKQHAVVPDEVVIPEAEAAARAIEAAAVCSVEQHAPAV